MQDLRGPRKIRPNLAADGWLVEFSLDGEPMRAVGVSTDEAAHDVAPGVRGNGLAGMRSRNCSEIRTNSTRQNS